MNKSIIGMIHLKSLPGSPSNKLSNEKIFEEALKDLKALEDGGIEEAIVENMFDIPFSTKITLDQIISYINIFTQLKTQSNISLGVNIQYANSDIEMRVASLCGGDFIRVEAFVEDRVGSFGNLHPLANEIISAKKNLNSVVNVYTDINVKHTQGLVDYKIEDSIKDAIHFGSEGIILTGVETGKPPTVEDAKIWKKVCNKTKLIIGSGINDVNIVDFLDYADGVIVGSSIKVDGNVEKPVDVLKVKKLINEVNKSGYKIYSNR